MSRFGEGRETLAPTLDSEGARFPDPFAPAPLGPIRLKNRLIKAATFEGRARRGEVTDSLIAFHRAFARGGVALTTLAYCAVSEDGRGAPNEIVVTRASLAGLSRLAEAVHEEGAAAAIQLGHAGPVGITVGQGLGPSRRFVARALRFLRAAEEADLRRIVRAFGEAAALACDAGFDAIELHFGHGYLVSAFLSPRLNRRRDAWGGGLPQRARLAREIAATVRERVGRSMAVIAKWNMSDGVEGGLTVSESLGAARLLEGDGHLDALELTGGSSFENPMFLFRGDVPLREMAAAFPVWLRLPFRLLGRRFLRAYPFEELFFLPFAREFRAALRMPLILLGGVSRLENVRTALREGFDFVALGRALLREPDLVARWARGDVDRAACIHCNKCMATIYRGTHCVYVPAEQRPGFALKA
ncbi:MAG: oxidoreductase [Candidatus Binatia bacterium]|nr:MAG: oxidoreductase [Candidatus Binatia bacterium]